MIERLPQGHWHGHVMRSLEVSGFILTEATHAAKSKLPRHAHDNSYFCYVLQGAYAEKYGSQEVICESSTVTFRASGDVHEDVMFDVNTRVFQLEMTPRWIERLREDSLTISRSPDPFRGALARLSARIYWEFHRTDGAASLAIEGIALEILAEAARRPSIRTRTTPRWLVDTRDLITEHFAEKLTLMHLAEQVGVHPVHLATAFKQRYRVTVGEFVRKLRIDHACIELKKRDLPLAAIALKAGFADQSHFSRVFRSHIGMSPAKYRRSIINS